MNAVRQKSNVNSSKKFRLWDLGHHLWLIGDRINKVEEEERTKTVEEEEIVKTVKKEEMGGVEEGVPRIMSSPFHRISHVKPV